MEHEKDLTTWEKEHPMFKEILALMRGEEMYALALPPWTHTYHMPTIMQQNDMRVLTLKNVGMGTFKWIGHWNKDSWGSDVVTEVVEFFATEKELNKALEVLWIYVLEAFEKRESGIKFGPGYVTGKIVNYAQLEKWVDKFPCLVIPDSVEEDRAAYTDANKKRLIEDARAKLEELEGK